MRVSIVTPSRDRPVALEHCARYVARQTRPPEDWLVVEDGDGLTPIPATARLIRRPASKKRSTVAENLLAAIDAVETDVLAIFADDDWYAPNYVEWNVEAMKLYSVSAVANPKLRYYHVGERLWREHDDAPGCAPLSHTVIHAALIPALRSACAIAAERGTHGIEEFFWKTVHKNEVHFYDEAPLSFGLKGIEGRGNLGGGGRPDKRRGWRDDSSGEKLREWIGDEDAERYL